MESRLLNSGQTPPKVSTQIQPYASPPRRLMAQSVEGVEGVHPDSSTWHSNQGLTTIPESVPSLCLDP